jgi:hypothetical protein
MMQNRSHPMTPEIRAAAERLLHGLEEYRSGNHDHESDELLDAAEERDRLADENAGLAAVVASLQEDLAFEQQDYNRKATENAELKRRLADDERPVTEDWLRSVGAEDTPMHWTFSDASWPLFMVRSNARQDAWVAHLGEDRWPIDIYTRGQVVALLRQCQPERRLAELTEDDGR